MVKLCEVVEVARISNGMVANVLVFKKYVLGVIYWNALQWKKGMI